MIPKVIHYCWFSGEEMSPFAKRCVATWKKKMPDYKLRLWDSNSIRHLISAVPFVRDAYNARKWAFVTDYVRLYALYTEGGVYMDTDVKVVRPFDEFLSYSFFSSHEVHPGFFESEPAKLDENNIPQNTDEFIYYWAIQAAIMGAEKGHPYLKNCIEYYNKKSFYDSNGNIDKDELIIGKHITRIAVQNYGYRYVDEDMIIDNNMLIKKSDVFVGNMIYYHRGHEYAIHLCNGSWKEGDKSWVYNIRNDYPAVYNIFVVPIIKITNKLSNLCKRII